MNEVQAAINKAEFSNPEDLIDSDDIINNLASLSPIEYEKERKEAAKKLGIDRVAVLDSEVEARRKSDSNDDADTFFEKIEPWPDHVDGFELIKDIKAIINRYAILPDAADITLSLWALFTYLHDVVRVSPRLALSSPQMRCGKTTVLSLMSALVYKALPASNITPAALFRSVEKWAPTLLIDEADTFIKDNDDLRGILNSGHTRSAAFVIRSVGDDNEPKKFNTFAPVLIAMIGDLPNTLLDRSIVILMRRKLPDEQVEPLRLDRHNGFAELNRKCLRWAQDNAEAIKELDPEAPKELNDRAADNWRILLSIAERIGGDLPEVARSAALTLSKTDEDQEDIGVALLRDIKKAFTEEEVIKSVDLVKKLISLEDRPWAEWYRGNPITPRGVARILSPFKIHPRLTRAYSNGPSLRGYCSEDFTDAFNRYLTPKTSVHVCNVNKDGALGDFSSVQEDDDCTLNDSPNQLNHKEMHTCTHKTDKNQPITKTESFSL